MTQMAALRSTPVTTDGFTSRALLSDGALDDRAIRDEELARARHAFAYLKDRIGNSGMRELLATDIASTTAQAREWVERSRGRWRTGQVELVDHGGVRVGYTMHQGRDAEDGMHLLLRTLLPEAAPQELVDRHLRHFAIEFTNWTRAAWLEAKEAKT